MVMGDMDGNLAEAERACASGTVSAPAPTPTPTPSYVVEEEYPTSYSTEEEHHSEGGSSYVRVHLSSDLPKTGTRSLFGGVSLSTRLTKSAAIGVQLQRERWVDLSTWRTEVQVEPRFLAARVHKVIFSASAVGGVGFALGGAGVGASLGGELSVYVPLTEKVSPSFTTRILKSYGYNGDNNGDLLGATQLQLMLGHAI